MPHSIEAIFFDVNGTLRSSVQSSDARRREKVQQILELMGAQMSVDDLSALLTSRIQAYRGWARQNSTELSEFDLWTRWMLPDFPPERIRKIALQLHQLWREATGVRTMFPEAKDVLVELFRRGYRLGIISNTLGTQELMSALRELEISGLFESVVLSSQVGIRKPHPGLLLEGANRLPIEPARCAYIGNRHDRDVNAAREAGFSKTVIIRNSQTHPEQDSSADASSADHYIANLRELLGIFPARSAVPARPAYEASLSTMWVRHNLPALPEFFEASRRLGFSSVELNHQVNSAMLGTVDLSRHSVSSLHEPCPADISTEQLRERDWLISSTDEDHRQHGVEAIQRSIDLADDLGLPVIVVHAGGVSTDMAVEQKLRKLFNAGQAGSAEFGELQAQLTAVRRSLAPRCLESVKKSLRELLDYAGRFGIRLGLENRFHFYDIPSLDEMGELLALEDASRLGFVYDVGHAQHLDRLGFYAHEDWLRRYASRIIEVHLHDVQGLRDHVAPGLGEVDFNMVASYLPQAAVRTLELQVTNSAEQVKAGLQYLAERGCIRKIAS